MSNWTAYSSQTAYHKCLLISTCDKNLMKLKTQTTKVVKTSNATDFRSMRGQIYQEAQIQVTSYEISSISYADSE